MGRRELFQVHVYQKESSNSSGKYMKNGAHFFVHDFLKIVKFNGFPLFFQRKTIGNSLISPGKAKENQGTKQGNMLMALLPGKIPWENSLGTYPRKDVLGKCPRKISEEKSTTTSTLECPNRAFRLRLGCV